MLFEGALSRRRLRPAGKNLTNVLKGGDGASCLEAELGKTDVSYHTRYLS